MNLEICMFVEVNLTQTLTFLLYVESKQKQKDMKRRFWDEEGQCQGRWRTVREEHIPKYIMDTVSLRMKSIILYNEYANEGWILGG